MTSQQLFSKLEEQRSNFLVAYNQSAPEQLRFRPDPESWNLLQVMGHIVKSERLSLAYIQRKISSSSNIPKAGFDSWFRYLILQIAFYLPIKFKAPKITQTDEEYPDFQSMKLEWDQVRDGFWELIDTTDSEILEKAIYRHPRAGLLNMKQALEFLSIHISHHQKQVERIRSHPSFPGNSN